jgi:hypothetical protein
MYISISRIFFARLHEQLDSKCTLILKSMTRGHTLLRALPLTTTTWIIQGVAEKYFGSSKVLPLGGREFGEALYRRSVDASPRILSFLLRLDPMPNSAGPIRNTVKH